MLFSDVLKAVHPHLMKDAVEAEFMRNIIQMLCDIPEDEWGRKKDPSSEESYSNESLRKFYNRGISITLAKKILGRLTHDNFIESIYAPNRSDVVLDGLAEDVAPFVNDPVSRDTVGDALFNLLKRGLEERIDPALENTRHMEEAYVRSKRLKGYFGSGLLEDSNYTCSMPGCSHHLQTLTEDGQSSPNYEIIVINEKKKPTFSNICTVCHDCFQKYVLKHSSKERTQLEAIKELQVDTRSARKTLSEIEIDKGITMVVESLINLKPDKLSALNYNPTSIGNKIDENKNLFLAETVKEYVTKYYFPINQIMQDLSRQKQYSDELVRAEIKSICIRLEDKGLSQIKIYENLSKQIHRITKQNLIYCNIVVCYFIQSCEVFHDITK